MPVPVGIGHVVFNFSNVPENVGDIQETVLSSNTVHSLGLANATVAIADRVGLLSNAMLEARFRERLDAQLLAAHSLLDWPETAGVRVEIGGRAGLHRHTQYVSRRAAPKTWLVFAPPSSYSTDEFDGWAADTIGTIVHELAHVVNRRERFSLLNEEAFAFMAQLCSDHISDGKIDYYTIRISLPEEDEVELRSDLGYWRTLVGKTKNLRDPTAAGVLVSLWLQFVTKGNTAHRHAADPVAATCRAYFEQPWDYLDITTFR